MSEDIDLPSGIASDVEQLVIDALVLETIRDNLHLLEPKEQVAITERVMKMRTAVDVAAELGVSGSYVAQLVTKGMEKLMPSIDRQIKSHGESHDG